MVRYENINGVPDFECHVLDEKKNKYCVLIPVLNEGMRIIRELNRANRYEVIDKADFIICDGDSTDGSMDLIKLKMLGVNTVLVKKGSGKQGAQLRMGIWWALTRGYDGIITVDGNHKDSIESLPLFIEKLDDGYDFVQGSRFIKGGHAINTPLSRLVAVKLLHAPVISLTARKRFTDTTNAYRAYSKKYLTDERVQPLRDIFKTYELLAYLSVRATQLKMRACEVPVTRRYPKTGATPTKISFFKGNFLLMKILFLNMLGRYNP